MSDNKESLRIAYFLMRYPVVSQTFIQREVDALCRLGHDVTVFAIWDFRRFQPDRDSAVPGVRPAVQRFSKWLLAWDVLRGAGRGLRYGANLPRAVGLLLTHWPRHSEQWFMTLWGTFAALALAGRVRRGGYQWAHGAWATAPATTAWVLAGLEVVPGFSFGAHAYDVFRHGGDALLPAKLKAAGLVHTTTLQTAAHLQRIRPEGALVLSRRGIERLPDSRAEEPTGNPWRLLTVARLVKKKGIPFQIAAVRHLAQNGLDVRLDIVGEGPLRAELEQQVEEMGLKERITFRGAVEPSEVARFYRAAHILWHTGVVDSEGDRDGLPNVIPEAMSHGLPVITSPEPGACEAVRHGETGLVVDPRNTEELAEAVTRLCGDAEMRASFGREGREWVRTHFLIDRNAAVLAEGVRALVAGD